MYYQYYEFPGAHSVRRHYGVRTEKYKLIHFYNMQEWELFDLEKDPNELNSVYGSPAYSKTESMLKEELTRLRKLYKVPEDSRPVKRAPKKPRKGKEKAAEKKAA